MDNGHVVRTEWCTYISESAPGFSLVDEAADGAVSHESNKKIRLLSSSVLKSRLIQEEIS